MAAMLVLAPTGSFAQNKGGKLIMDGKAVAVKEIDGQSRKTAEAFGEFKRKLGMKDDKAQPMFFCTDEYCGCVGGNDCGKLLASGLCQDMEIPGAWICGISSSGAQICSCLRGAGDVGVVGGQVPPLEYAPN